MPPPFLVFLNKNYDDAVSDNLISPVGDRHIKIIKDLYLKGS